jgi:hypothetical protein
MLGELEEKQILKLNDLLAGQITISLIESEHINFSRFKEFCDNLSRLVPGIRVKKDGDSPQKPPQIVISDRLRYQTVPSGHELQPFLESLAAISSDPPAVDNSGMSRLNKDRLPASLTLFIAPQCTYCPSVVRQLTPLPLIDDKIQLVIIDGTLFPEISETYNISAVPTLLIDEQFRWTGAVPLDEIIDTINTRDPISLGAASLENILTEGQAGDLAAMMLEGGRIFPAFPDLLIHEKWHIRLGAMVVMEEIADQKPALASEVVDFLWEKFHGLPDQVKGDILYILGEIKDQRAVTWLKEVVAGDYGDEVKEAAQEAIEKMPKRPKMS